MKHQNVLNSSKTLSILCQDQSKFSTRFALLTFQHKRFSIISEATIVLFDYLQLISLILILNSPSDEDRTGSKLHGVISFAKIFQPGSWISFKEPSSIHLVIMIIVMVILVLRYIIFGYISAMTLSRKSVHIITKQIWMFIFRIQGRILCQFLTSFWVQDIVSFLKKENNYSILSKDATIILGLFIFVAEYSFSFFLQIKFCYLLPAKNWLASKNNHLEVLNLIQKLIVQAFQMAFASRSFSTNIWSIIPLMLFLNLLQIFQSYKALPLYNLKALRFQTALLMALTSLNTTCFIRICAWTAGDRQLSTVDFIIVTWVILSILSVRMSYTGLNKLFFKILSSSNSKLSPHFLLQKARLIQDLRKLWTGPNESREKYDWYYLVNKSVNASLEEILDLKGGEISENKALDINCKKSRNTILARFLDKILLKNNLIKFHLAYLYAKKLKLYGFALRFIHELQKNDSSQVQLNCAILIHEIQNSIQEQYRTETDTLSILPYLNIQDQVAKLKRYMMNQAELQIHCYQEILVESPDLARIFDNSQKAYEIQHKIDVKIQKLCKAFPESYYEHLQLFSEYSLRINFCLDDYIRYRKMYATKCERYDRFLNEDELNLKSFYDQRNVLMVMSGRKGEAGKIVYLSKNADQLVGGDANRYIGMHVSAAGPPGLVNFLMNYWKTASDTGARASSNYSGQLLFMHRDGYMVLANAYICIHPFITQGLYFDLVIRPVLASNIEVMLVKENGEIDSTTRKIAKQLNLLRPFGTSKPAEAFNIKSISEEFARANKAFNTVEYANKHGEEELISKKFTENAEEEEVRRSSTTPKTSTKLVKTLKSVFLMKKEADNNRLLSLDEAEELQQAFTVGKEIILTPRVADNNEHERGGKSHAQSPEKYLYRCQIVNFAPGGEYYKMVFLEELAMTSSEDGGSTNGGRIIEKRKKSSFEKNFLSTRTFEDPEHTTNVFEVENEKQDGWIDFGTLRSSFRNHQNKDEQDQMTATAHQEDFPTNDRLFMPLASSSHRPLMMATANHRSPTNQEKNRKSLMTRVSEEEEAEAGGNTSKGAKEKEKMKMIIGQARSIHSSKFSKSSQQRKLSVAYKYALNTKFYPRLFEISYKLFYGMMIALYTSQIILHVVVDKTVENITQRKAVLSNAQLSNFFLVHTSGIFRVLSDTNRGQFTMAELGVLSSLTGAFRFVALDALDNLNGVNQDMLEATKILTAENMKRIFNKDVKMYNEYFDSSDQSYLEMDLFAGASQIVESGRQLLNVNQLSSAAGLNKFQYIYRNALNDLFIKNQAVSSIFSESVSDKRKEVEAIANEVSALTLVFFLIVTGVIIYLIWKQCKEEKFFMFSVIKLNSSKIKEIVHSVHEFKRNLNSDEIFHDMMYPEIIHNSTNKYETKKELSKTPKEKGINVKYLLHIVKVTLIFFVIVGMTVYFLLTLESCLKGLNYWQAQDYFSKYVRTRSYLSQVVSQELLSGAASATIEGIPLEEHLKESIKKIAELRVKASTAFQNEDGTYDPIMKQLLYEDGCSFVNPTFSLFCNGLYSKGMRTGYIYLLNSLEDLLQARLDRYQSSDKSAQALRDIKAMDLELSILLIVVIPAEGDQIEAIISEKYHGVIEESDSKRNVATALFSLTILILAIGMRIKVLRELRACYNHFKNVLRTLPLSLVLSTFGLESFLLKTSNGTLDFMKNQIN